MIIISLLVLLAIIAFAVSWFFLRKTDVVSTTTATPSPTFVFPEIHPTVPSYPPSHYLAGKRLQTISFFKVPEDWTRGDGGFASGDGKYLISLELTTNEQPYQRDFTEEEFNEIARGIFPKRLAESRTHCESNKDIFCTKNSILKYTTSLKNGVPILEIIDSLQTSDSSNIYPYSISKTVYIISNQKMYQYAVAQQYNSQGLPFQEQDPSPFQVFDEIINTFDPTLLD